jgi:SAM-dependent methyltransferase
MYSPLREITSRLFTPVVLGTWVYDRLFDGVMHRRFGIESSKRHGLDEFGINHSEFVDYQPMSYLDISRLLDKVLQPNLEGTFIDFGCGKGRVVCMAAMRSYRRVIGVEVSAKLATVARNNVARVEGRLRCPAEIVTTDATVFDVPDDANVFLFNNPFRGAVFGKVLENIRVSVERRPRRAAITCSGGPNDTGLQEPFQGLDWLPIRENVKFPTGSVAVIYHNR